MEKDPPRGSKRTLEADVESPEQLLAQVQDQLRSCLNENVLQEILDSVVSAGESEAFVTAATLNNAYAAEMSKRLPILFADYVAAAAQELREVVAAGTFTGVTSLCRFPAFRRLVRMRDGLRVNTKRFLRGWPRNHPATRAKVEPTELGSVNLDDFPILDWLGSRFLSPNTLKELPVELRECGSPDNVPFYVMYYVLRDRFPENRSYTGMFYRFDQAPWDSGHSGNSLFSGVTEQWMASDWAGCCVTLLSDYMMEPFGQQMAIKLIWKHAMKLDMTVDLGPLMSSVYSEHADRKGIMPLFDFYRGRTCALERHLRFPPMTYVPAGFTGTTWWYLGTFLDEISDDKIRHNIRSGSSPEEKRATLGEAATSLRVYIRLDRLEIVHAYSLMEPSLLPAPVRALIGKSVPHLFPDA